MKPYHYIPVLLLVSSFFAINYSSNWTYYYQALVIWGIWPVLFLLRKLQNYYKSFWVLGIVGICLLFWNSLYTPCSINDSVMAKEYDAMESCFAGRSDIKVLYFGMENGFGITANALPSCKYWSRQNKATKEMILNNELCAINHLCDYVFLDLNREYTYDCIKLLAQYNYEKIHTMYYHNDKYMDVYALKQK